MAIQTVFEGHHKNTFKRVQEIQKKYNIKIPFAHDTGDAPSHNRSNTMIDYKTGGTPWFIIIDKSNKVRFNDYHLDVEKTIEYLQNLANE